MDLCPRRAPDVETQPEGDDLRITAARSPHAGVKLLSRFLSVPERKTYLLDSLGSETWKMCDGRTRVRDIVERMAVTHGWPPERAEKAVLVYLSTLSGRKLLNFGSQETAH